MANKLAKLIDVKSIVTLILTVVFAALTLMGRVSAEQFLTVYTTVTCFYFGVQFQKRKKEEGSE